MSAAVWRKSLCNTCLNWEFTPGALGLLLQNDNPNTPFVKGLSSAVAEREQALELSGRGVAWDVHKVEVGRIKKKKADRALVVMERPHHIFTPSRHAFLPSSQGLTSGAEQSCVGE